MELPLETTVQNVKGRLDAGERLRLLDVREPQEFQICSIAGAERIPMRNVPQHLQDLDRDGETLIVFCHHGMRSLSVVDWLRKQGVENCQSMAGGIDAWSVMIDPSVPRY